MFDRDFFWNLFFNTGRIDAYLLLKQQTPPDEISANEPKETIKQEDFSPSSHTTVCTVRHTAVQFKMKYVLPFGHSLKY